MMKQQLETAKNTMRTFSLKDAFNIMTRTELLENVILLLLCRICFMEYLVSPFGVAFFSVLFYRNRRPSYVIFSALGAILSGYPTFYFKYIGTLLIIMSVMIIFSKELKSNQRLVAILSSSALFLNGGVYVMVEGFFLYDILLLLMECGVCYLSFFIFSSGAGCLSNITSRKIFEPKEIVSLVILIACCVLSISLVENLVPLAHIMATFCILFLSLSCGFSISTPAGAVLGLSLGLASAFPAQAVCSYTLSSLFSGLVSRYGRLSVSGIFAFCTFFVTILLSPESSGFIAVSYVAASCLLLYFIPDKFIYSFGTAATNPQNTKRKDMRIKEEVEMSFSDAIGTVDSVSDIFTDIVKEGCEIEVADRNTVFQNTVDAVCKNCSLCRFCWHKDREKSLSLLADLMSSMEKKSTLRKSDVPKDFSDMCIRCDGFLTELNKNFESYKVTKMWSGKVAEGKKLVVEQFKNISMILKDVQENLLEKTAISHNTETKILTALDKIGVTTSGVRIFSADGFTVEIHNPDFYINSNAEEKIAEELTDIFDVPMVLTQANTQKLIYSQKTEFKPVLSIATLPRKNSAFCGDNCTYFTFGTGKLAIVLSDGMGSGEAAAFQSNVAVTLAKKLLTSGFSTQTCVRLINNILMTNADRETFATVDLCVVNLYSGIAEFVKTGAAPSYIKQEKEEITISSSSLPAGLISSPDADFSIKYLKSGDTLILASDGITDCLDRPDKNEIFELCKVYDNPNELSQKILDLSLSRSGGIATDDLTVCVCKLEKNL